MDIVGLGQRGMICLTVLLAFVAAVRLLKADLAASGLFVSVVGEPSPSRIQAFLVSVGAAVVYLGEILYGDATSIPTPSPTVVTLLGLSGGVYLGGKLAPGLIADVLTQVLDFFARRGKAN